MASVFRAYNTSAFLFYAGDLIAQHGIERLTLKEHDYARSARLTFYGGAIYGPAITKWYQFLNRIRFPSPTKAIIYRVFLDQSIITPLAVGCFFASMTILEGLGISEMKQRLSEAYTSTVLVNWCVLIPTQVINFGFVPHHLQFLVVSVVNLCRNTYLSAVNEQQVAEAREETSKTA